MGMFDNVRCEVALPDGFEGRGLQTKDFGCTMATITITEDGRLVTDQRDWWREDEAEPLDLQFHGYFRFYGSEGRHATDTWKWHEYRAKFTDGRMVGIEAVQDEYLAQVGTHRNGGDAKLAPGDSLSDAVGSEADDAPTPSLDTPND